MIFQTHRLIEVASKRYRVTEGISGYYFYHLSPVEDYTYSLCGKNTMQTHIPLSSWGEKGPSHIRYKWCSMCKELSEKKDTK